MKKIVPLVFGLSLVLNVALAVFLVRGSSFSGAESLRSASATSAQSAASTSLKIDSGIWTAVQTSDLPAMVARLRAAGFPPDVIRAILGTELGEQFIARRQELDPEETTRPFWKTRPANPKITAEILRLSREHAKIVRDLLGEGAEDPMSRAYQNRRLEGLPSDKVGGVKRILRDYDEMRSDIYSGGMIGTADREKLAAIDKAQREDMAQLLTPGELLEYGVRSGPVADQLRSQLTAFNPTEAEFRAIYQRQQSFNEQFGNFYGPLSAEQQRQRNEAQKQLTEQIKAALGPERGSDYVRATDYNYRQTSQLVARLALPAETANQVWSVQQDIQQRLQTLTADKSLPPEQRAQQITQQLAVLADEARTKISATLGERGFEAYKQYGGQWMQQLQPNAAPGAAAPASTSGVMIFR